MFEEPCAKEYLARKKERKLKEVNEVKKIKKEARRQQRKLIKMCWQWHYLMTTVLRQWPHHITIATDGNYDRYFGSEKNNKRETTTV